MRHIMQRKLNNQAQHIIIYYIVNNCGLNTVKSEFKVSYNNNLFMLEQNK